MSQLRRSVIRPAPPAASPRSQPTPQLQKMRSRLAKDQLVLVRWMARLKRAFHVVERTQQRIRRWERLIARQED